MNRQVDGKQDADLIEERNQPLGKVYLVGAGTRRSGVDDSQR